MTNINISSSLLHRHLRRPPGWVYWIHGWRQRTCASYLSSVAYVRLMWTLCSLCPTFPATAHLGNNSCSVYKVALNMKNSLHWITMAVQISSIGYHLPERENLLDLFPQDKNHEEHLCPLSISWGHWHSCKVSYAFRTVSWWPKHLYSCDLHAQTQKKLSSDIAYQWLSYQCTVWFPELFRHSDC